jgi:hypothetical protein
MMVSGQLHIPVCYQGKVPWYLVGGGGRAVLNSVEVENREISDSVGNQTLVFGLQSELHIFSYK